jgi:hypothetical protein
MPYDGKNWDETSLALLKAANVIRERGWAQGCYESDSGNVCILGAIRIALWNDASGLSSIHVSDKNIAVKRVEDYIKQSPDRWNDRKGRTEKEVIELLETVAAISGATVK